MKGSTINEYPQLPPVISLKSVIDAKRAAIRGNINGLANAKNEAMLMASNENVKKELLTSTPSISNEMTGKIESTKKELTEAKESKSQQPVVVNNTVASSGGGSSGGGTIGEAPVGGARNTESSTQRINDRYISSGMV